MRPYSDFRPTDFDPKGVFIHDDRSLWLVAPVSQTRDSGCLDRSNFETFGKMLKTAGAEEATDFELCRFGHWGPGWFEIYILRPGSPAETVGSDAVSSLADHPVLDENHFSETEQDEACQSWGRMRIWERVKICRHFKVSVFAARHNEIPQDDSGALFDYLKGN